MALFLGKCSNISPKIIKSPLLDKYINSDISFVRITSIEKIGKHQCYDLTVPGDHNFICNNMLVHNTTFLINWFLYLAKIGVPNFLIECEIRRTRLG